MHARLQVLLGKCARCLSEFAPSFPAKLAYPSATGTGATCTACLLSDRHSEVRSRAAEFMERLAQDAPGRAWLLRTLLAAMGAADAAADRCSDYYALFTWALKSLAPAEVGRHHSDSRPHSRMGDALMIAEAGMQCICQTIGWACIAYVGRLVGGVVGPS
jgi:hypothetical protein